MKTRDDFHRNYTPDDSVQSEGFNSSERPGMLAPFGPDLRIAKAIQERAPGTVWTMLDSSEGLVLLQGCHMNDRLYFIVTVEAAESSDESYLMVDKEEAARIYRGLSGTPQVEAPRARYKFEEGAGSLDDDDSSKDGGGSPGPKVVV